MENYIVEGNISVKAVILANRRKVSKVMVDQEKKDKDTAYILRQAKARKIPVIYTSRSSIDELAQGKTHGGIIAFCQERRYQNLSKIIKKQDIFLALIEGVEDPFNFGYVLRTLYAAGCDAVIVGPRNWTTAADVVTKSSAGASEYINICVSYNLDETLQTLQQNKVELICAHRKDAQSLYSYQFPERICIAIGGEMRGLSKTVISYSNQNLFIPYRNDFKNAMTAAASTAIFAFEVVRQKSTTNK